MARAGVTRVADVTGLDHIGVPTTLAIRPNAPTMACSSGKGLTLDQAFVSGAMEAFELFASETAQFDPFRSSYRELAESYPLPAKPNFAFTRHNIFTFNWPYSWCLGWDILSQQEYPIPMAMVGMSRIAMANSLRTFQVSSNGLGAGNSFLEAIAAGLYEVVERDGVACSYYAALHRNRGIPVVAHETLYRFPKVAAVIEQCAAADVRVFVQDCTVDTLVPTYLALAHDRSARGVPVMRGSGTHLDPEIALLRAITEALQGRLNFIAGSRDDIFRTAYIRARSSWADSVRMIDLAEQECPPAPEPSSLATNSFEADISYLLSSIEAVGLNNVVVFDLTPVDFPVHVVRVVVPGMEGYMHFGYQPGIRALSYGGDADMEQK